MTETETQPTTTPTDDWKAQFAALKARFPKVKDSIVFAIHALQSNPDIALDDLKAQANLHGIRVMDRLPGALVVFDPKGERMRG